MFRRGADTQVDFLKYLLGLVLGSDAGGVARFNAEVRAALPRVIGIMEEAGDDVGRLELCFAILEEYCFENETNSAFLSETSVMDTVLISFEQHPGARSMTLHACGYLVNCAISTLNRKAFGAKGGAKAVIDLSNANRADEEILKLVLMILRNMCCLEAENQFELANHKGIESVIRIASEHITSSEMLSHALGVILHLSLNHTLRKKLINESCFELLANILQIQPVDSVVESACRALVNLSSQKSELSFFVPEGLFKAILICMDERSHSQDVVQLCITAIGNLTDRRDTAAESLHEGVLEVLLDALEDKRFGPGNTQGLVTALSNLVSNDEEAKRIVCFESNAFSVLVTIMSANRRDHTLLLACASILKHGLECSGVLREKIGKSFMPVILNIIQSGDSELAKEFLDVLIEVCIQVASHKFFIEEDGFIVLGEALRDHQSVPSVVSRVCRVFLRVLASTVSWQEDESTICKSLISALKSSFMDLDATDSICSLLLFVTANEEQWSRQLVAEGAIPVVFEVARVYIANADALKSLTSVLLNLASCDGAAGQIIGCNGTQFIAQAMERHIVAFPLQIRCAKVLAVLVNAIPGLESLMTATELISLIGSMCSHLGEVEFQVLCCWMLSELSNRQSSLVKIHSCGAVDAVLVTLAHHMAQPDVAKHGLNVLCNYSASAQLTDRFLLPEDTADVVFGTSLTLRKVPEVLLLGLTVMGNIADRDKDKLLRLSLPNFILTILNEYPGEILIQTEGLACLCKLAAACGDWELTEGVGGVRALVKFQRNARSDAQVQLSVVRAFKSMAVFPQTAQRLLTEGGVNGLIESTSLEDDDIKHMALIALAAVCHRSADDELMVHDIARVLANLAMRLLHGASESKVIAASALLLGEVIAKPHIFQILKKEAVVHSIASALERSGDSEAINIIHYNTIRLLCGYALCAVVTSSEIIQQALPPLSDFLTIIWHCAQDMRNAHAMQQEYYLTGGHLETAQRAFEVMSRMDPDLLKPVFRSDTFRHSFPEQRPLPVEDGWEAMERAQSRDNPEPEMLPKSLKEDEVQLLFSSWAPPASVATNAIVSLNEKNIVEQLSLAAYDSMIASRAREVEEVPVPESIHEKPRWKETSTSPQWTAQAKIESTAEIKASIKDRQEKIARDKYFQEALRRASTRRSEGTVEDVLKARIQDKALWEEQEEFERHLVQEQESESRRKIKACLIAYIKACSRKNTSAYSQSSFYLASSMGSRGALPPLTSALQARSPSNFIDSPIKGARMPRADTLSLAKSSTSPNFGLPAASPSAHPTPSGTPVSLPFVQSRKGRIRNPAIDLW